MAVGFSSCTEDGFGVGPETLYFAPETAQQVLFHFILVSEERSRSAAAAAATTRSLRHGAGVPGNHPRAPTRGAVGPGGSVLVGDRRRRQARSGARFREVGALRPQPRLLL